MDNNPYITGDRLWMYKRKPDNKIGCTEEFYAGVDAFIDYIKKFSRFMDGKKFRSPCKKCKNKIFQEEDDVKDDLYQYGFIANNEQWTCQGEHVRVHIDMQNEVDEDIVSYERAHAEPNLMREMVEDLTGTNFDPEDPNINAKAFFDILSNADTPLYLDCKKHTQLSFITEMLNIKTDFNLPQEAFNRLLKLMLETLPKGATLPKDFYESKKMVRALGLGHQMIDACPSGCMLYYRLEHKELECCIHCGRERYKPRSDDSKNSKRIAYKKLRYFSLGKRLQRLYMSKNTAKHMTWHYDKRRAIGELSHPSDGEAWKHFDSHYPDFAAEPKNVRLGLCSDGFTPFGVYGSQYSCWPVIITPYNLPPWMCMKNPYMFLSLIIPEPENPKRNIDVYMQPLIDELKELWSTGIET